MKRCGVVASGLPNASDGGGSIALYGVILELLELGIEVHVCTLHSGAVSEKMERQRTALEKLGAKVTFLALPPPRNSREKMMPAILATETVAQWVRQLSPQGILAYSYEGVFATEQVTGLPIFALLADPYHLVRWNAWWYSCYKNNVMTNLKEGISSLVYHVLINRQLKRGLKKTAHRGAIAAHHAQWYGRFDGRGCRYYCGRLEDTAGPRWQELRAAQRRGLKKYKLIHVGNTGGTTNRPGIIDFVQTILPRLEEKLGTDRSEIHFLGHAENAEPCLKAVCTKKKNIILRGQVSPIDDEFLSADLMFVPNPITLGNRTRIISSWSFGCPVVSHTANIWGIPQLRHDDNVLLSRNGHEMAEQIVSVLSQPKLAARLSLNGRRDFEAYFDLKAAGATIAQDMALLIEGGEPKVAKSEGVCNVKSA